VERRSAVISASVHIRTVVKERAHHRGPLGPVPSPPPALDPNHFLWTLLGASLGLALGYGLGVALFRPR
jgi:hypothetical protein